MFKTNYMICLLNKVTINVTALASPVVWTSYSSFHTCLGRILDRLFACVNYFFRRVESYSRRALFT